ncbi:S9 family peptidase [Steroidobacter sp.]|uniref:S9 family peptidase n=1 Tax=Steroidobacter sp. TaxID=1978227 RepID=UPI001A54D652|nr:DPP IV N-terminal domain-containing protein [Steroidobacter sp.]MBL8270020.1 DPP IV N-terminal domain-containing protein [Steroidobacter sp.]
MNTESRSAGALLALVMGCGFAVAQAQGTLADYQRAEQLLPWNARKLVLNAAPEPHWLSDREAFWYRQQTKDGDRFMLVDARTGKQTPTADPDQAASNETPESDPVLSPDGRWSAHISKYNLYLRDTASGRDTALTQDGETAYDYASAPGSPDPGIVSGLLGRVRPAQVLFSPDSRKLLTYRLDQRQVGQLHLVQTKNGSRSVLHSYPSALPGDEYVPQSELMLFDVTTGQRLRLDAPKLPTMFHSLLEEGARYRKMWWNDSSTRVYFIEDQRGYKGVRLYSADVRTGETRKVFEEHSDTYLSLDITVRLIDDGKLILWASERDGWNHLYLIDSETGQIRNRVTEGAWVMRSVEWIDQRERWIYFIGSGREAGRDPYYRHLYRVRFDGSGLQLLTPENADHDLQFSPSGKFFTDTYSRVDAAPVSVLRSAKGKLVSKFSSANIDALLRTGWKFPEPFTAKARDGVTDIYGLILRPSNFDPARRYPVIDDVYPGPQHAKVFKSFSVEPPSALWAQATAELGFIVVLIDGKGTPYRSRAFREASFGNMGEAGGLEDHIAVLKQLASKYSFLDLDRVGIYGNSGGGYATARALLKYPEFYKVGVAAAGNHDQRTYIAPWGERWQGYPVDAESYRLQANSTLAQNLKGKLLLVHGDMDDNVPVGNTLQLANALIEANKDFDMLILPNRDHVFADVTKPEVATARAKAGIFEADPYFLRKRWDYFVRYLLGVEPPAFRIQLEE